MLKNKGVDNFASALIKLKEVEMNVNLTELKVKPPEISREQGYKIIRPRNILSCSDNNRNYTCKKLSI